MTKHKQSPKKYRCTVCDNKIPPAEVEEAFETVDDQFPGEYWLVRLTAMPLADEILKTYGEANNLSGSWVVAVEVEHETDDAVLVEQVLRPFTLLDNPGKVQTKSHCLRADGDLEFEFYCNYSEADGEGWIPKSCINRIA